MHCYISNHLRSNSANRIRILLSHSNIRIFDYSPTSEAGCAKSAGISRIFSRVQITLRTHYTWAREKAARDRFLNEAADVFRFLCETVDDVGSKDVDDDEDTVWNLDDARVSTVFWNARLAAAAGLSRLITTFDEPLAVFGAFDDSVSGKDTRVNDDDSHDHHWLIYWLLDRWLMMTTTIRPQRW